MTQHQPKGSMCQTCCGGSRACSTPPFASMPVIKAYPDGVKAVKCSAHQPAIHATSRRCPVTKINDFKRMAIRKS